MRRHNQIKLKSLFLVSIFFILTSLTYAQDSKKTATVYFMRTIGNRSALGAMNIFVDSVFQCKLNESKYFSRSFNPGVHLFSVQAEGKKYKDRIEQIPLQLEAGQVYYMQLAVMYGTLFNYLYLKEVTQNTADLVMPRLIQDASCAK